MVEPMLPSIEPPLLGWTCVGGGACFTAGYEYDMSDTRILKSTNKRIHKKPEYETNRIKKQRHNTCLGRWSAGSRTRSCTSCGSPCKTIYEDNINIRIQTMS